jgi:hypothetical protein
MTWASPAPNEQPRRSTATGGPLTPSAPAAAAVAPVAAASGTASGGAGAPPPAAGPQAPAGEGGVGASGAASGSGGLAGLVASGMEAAGFGEFAVNILVKQHPELDRLFVKAMAAQRGYSIEATDQYLTEYKNKNSGLAQGGVVKQGADGAWASVEGQFEGGSGV